MRFVATRQNLASLGCPLWEPLPHQRLAGIAQSAGTFGRRIGANDPKELECSLRAVFYIFTENHNATAVPQSVNRIPRYLCDPTRFYPADARRDEPHALSPLALCSDAAPVYPLLEKMFGRWVTSTDLLAAAMLQLAMVGSKKKRLNTGELNTLAAQAAGR